jgi:hypothetical protein
MMTRCYNEKELSYRFYGARGIKVCDRWRGEGGFERFLSDVGQRPSSLHSLDRKDVDADYCLENCRWATKVEQANNKRTTIRVGVDGQTVSLKSACRSANMPYEIVRKRMILGATFQDAISEPVRDRHFKSLAVKCREAGLSYNTVYARVRNGWTEERALSTPIR